MSATERELAVLGDKATAVLLFLPLTIFGCLAVIEENVFDLLDVLRDKETA